MKLLLDTHVWLWRLLEPERLSAEADRHLSDPGSALHLSSISVWETAVLARRGRLSLSPSPAAWILDALRRSSPIAVPVDHAIALRSEALEGLATPDPADRFIAASAIERGLVLVTADQALRSYKGVQTLW